jgi:hypothetical protein
MGSMGNAVDFPTNESTKKTLTRPNLLPETTSGALLSSAKMEVLTSEGRDIRKEHTFLFLTSGDKKKLEAWNSDQLRVTEL